MRLLDELGAVTPADRAVLVRYCRAWADWVELDELVATTGLLIKGRNGDAIRNPAVKMRQDAGATLLELGRELALSPASRLRLSIAHEAAPEVGELPADGLGQAPAVLAEYRRMLGAG